MAVVPIRINGKDYQVACDDGEEDRLHMLAGEVDDRIQTLIFNMKNKPSEPMSLLLAGLMMSDEVIEKQKEIESLQQKIVTLEQEMKKMTARMKVKQDYGDDGVRIAEMESAMADTMEEIAMRIEKMANRIEV